MNWDLQGIAAVIGALAWIPIVGQWLTRLLSKPRLQIVLADAAEVGYTFMMTVCNVQAAIRVSGKPALVTAIELALVHQNGRRLELAWNGMSEVLSTFESSGGDRGAHTRTVPAVAMLVRPDSDLLQRKVMFNDRTGNADMSAFYGELQRRIERLGSGTTIDAVRASDEYKRLLEEHLKRFAWEAGKYVGTMTVTVADLPLPVAAGFSFILSEANVNLLRSNIRLLDRHIDNMAVALVAGTAPPPLPTYSWINPLVKPTPL